MYIGLGALILIIILVILLGIVAAGRARAGAL